MKLMRLIAVLLLVSPGTSVIAQEQTVEGAQTFLSKVLPGNGYLPGVFSTRLAVWGSLDRDDQSRYQGVGRITEVRSPERCRTAIFFDPAGLYVQTRERIYYNSEPTRRWGSWRESPGNLATALDTENYRVNAIAGAPAGFSWSDVLEVKVTASGTGVFITQKGIEKPAWVEMGGKDMATRVAYAMEFLKSNCDKAAGTGF